MSLIIALAMVAPVTFLAMPAGAAASETCGSLAGRAVFKPPLPPIGKSTRVVTTISSQTGLNFSACTNPAGSSGSFSFKAKAKSAQNCQTIGTAGVTAVGTGTIKWQKGVPSTLSTLTFVFPKRSKSLVATLTASITKGQFAGQKLTATISFAPANHSCQAPNGLSQATLGLPRGTKLTIVPGKHQPAATAR